MGRQRGGSAQERFEFRSAIDMARALPNLFRPISAQPKTLTSDERQSLAQCEAAVDTLKWAFWLAGKALQIIRDSRLYRAEHNSFEDYCWTRWGMKANYAGKLIRTWQVAEALFDLASNDSVPIGTPRLSLEQAKKANQAQVWELVSVRETWSVEEAVFVYATVAASDVPVTAEVLRGAVNALPKGEEFDKEVAKAAIHAFLDNWSDEKIEGEVDITARAQKAVSMPWVRRLARKDRAAAERYLNALEAEIAKCREQLTEPAKPKRGSGEAAEPQDRTVEAADKPEALKAGTETPEPAAA
ncbi:putative protein OS=Streptomyces fumanus OX=67302 GN=GCM10018772_70470 PE=4 SV=1 [Streptomyces fumanus]|uniref:Uncharacterized protein n=1 Tax=Streptomyces fumanus TaxID=67302 RepID=A0A919B1H0_9ACTN|nr:hypothetical protein [Streptomyces fumanus]GHF34839.1 hypothetical protein GCM10018772_70470 [Streptomyces fumanus]